MVTYRWRRRKQRWMTWNEGRRVMNLLGGMRIDQVCELLALFGYNLLLGGFDE